MTFILTHPTQCILTSNLFVNLILFQIARKVGDPDIPRPWSQYSSKKENKTTEDEKKNADTKSLSLLKTERWGKNLGNDGNNEDPQLQEFLQVMQPRVKSKLWANDMSVAPASNQHGKGSQKQAQTENEIVEKSASVDMESDEIDEVEDRLSDGQAAKTSQNLVHADVVSDMDYFKSRVKKDWSDSDSSDSDDLDDDADDELVNRSLKGEVVQERAPNGQHNSLKHDVTEQEDRDEGPHKDSDGEVPDQGKTSSSSVEDEKEKVLETGRLFVRNLPYTAT